MNPEPSAGTTPFRTRRHTGGDLKIGVDGPNACMVNRENGEIFRFDLTGVALVCNGHGTTHEIVYAVGMIRLHSPSRTRIFRIIAIANVTSFSRGKVGCCAFVTSDFGRGGLSSREFKNITSVGGKVEMVMEPPFLESLAPKRCNRPILDTGEILVRHVEAKGTRMNKCWKI